MEGDALPTVRIFPFEKSATQVAALRSLVESWGERFWAWPAILQASDRPGSLVLYAAESAAAPRWDGVVLADVGAYQADLLYIHVREEARRRGIGAGLFSALVDGLGARQQVEDLFLEVRRSNAVARSLYAGFGLEEVGVRSRYYQDGEDAVILRYRLRAASGRGGST